MEAEHASAMQEFYDAVAAGSRPKVMRNLQDVKDAMNSALVSELAVTPERELAAIRPQAILAPVAVVIVIVVAISRLRTFIFCMIGVNVIALNVTGSRRTHNSAAQERFDHRERAGAK